MYNILLTLHSLIRWFVLFSLLLAIYKAYTGVYAKRIFTKTDNRLRHWTATIAHIQLVIGMLLYTQSPNAVLSFKTVTINGHVTQPFFFGVVHLAMMLLAVTIITIGSAMAKRKPTDHAKFKTILIWFGMALFIILMAIPWPFSPLAQRPYLHGIG
ncbi:hypothetical protein ACFQZX_11760 [Mucilaginibacter litoreus]|uniref:Cytochrome C and Quinol oxidase polypeptide I n=1 Tax=Mucilaginibacter litoreus TaxID=1048221 RepID=A0ABW3ATW1_9SPHI